MDSPIIAIASHRGGARLWPENSLAAIRASLAHPVEEVAVDVHLSFDDVPVVIQDALLDRTTAGRGAVRAHRAAAVAALALRDAPEERVPTLAEVAALVAGTPCRLRVELRIGTGFRVYPGFVARVLAVLEAAGLRDRAVLASVNAELAGAAAAAGVAAAWLPAPSVWRDIGLAGAVGVARAHGVGEICLPAALCDGRAVAAIREAGLRVSAWGATDAAALDRMLAAAPDLVLAEDPLEALARRPAPAAAAVVDVPTAAPAEALPVEAPAAEGLPAEVRAAETPRPETPPPESPPAGASPADVAAGEAQPAADADALGVDPAEPVAPAGDPALAWQSIAEAALDPPPAPHADAPAPLLPPEPAPAPEPEVPASDPPGPDAAPEPDPEPAADPAAPRTRGNGSGRKRRWRF